MYGPASNPVGGGIVRNGAKADQSSRTREVDRDSQRGDSARTHRLEQLLQADARANDFFSEGAKALGKAAVESAVFEGPGDSIGPYKLLERLGEGGCGVVYRAQQESPVRRQVALKIIKLGMDTREVVARFEAERQALAVMDHPNIAKIHDAGATETGRPYFVMELVEGTKLTSFCDEQKISIRDRLDIFTRVCQAVQHAHQKGIIHRDLKPSNIVVSNSDGRIIPKVIDFGIAKATQGRLTEMTLVTCFERLIGTPAYMSPEQAEVTNSDIDTRTDIYSLGVLLYELLTGRTPFDHDQLLTGGIDEMRRRIRQEEPLAPSACLRKMVRTELSAVAERRRSDGWKLIQQVARDLDWIVAKCLEKDRKRRYATVNALASDVARYLGNLPITARAPSTLYQLHKFVARNSVAVFGGAAFLLALIGGTAVSTFQAFRAHHAELEEQQQRKEAERARGRAEGLLKTLKLEKAEMLFTVRDCAGALANLARILREDPSNKVAASRLISALGQRAFFLPTEVVATHTAELKSVQFSPNEKQIVTASYDRTVRTWDISSGQKVLEIKPGGFPTWASFSPDGRMIVSGTYEGSVRLWSARDGHPLGAGWNVAAQVTHADFSPDGRQLAVAGGDVRLITIGSNDEKEIELTHGGQATSVRFSPDGTKLATGSLDGSARIWNPSTGALIQPPFQNEGRIWLAEFSPDGQRLLTAGFPFARVYDLASRKILLQTPEPLAEIYWAQFTLDGGRIFIKARDHTVRMIDSSTGESVGEPLHMNEHPEAVALSRSGKFAAIGFEKTRARIWQTPQPGPGVTTFAGSIPARQSRVKFSKTGELLAVSDSSRVNVWDLRTGQLACKPLEHSHRTAIFTDFSPDGRWLATGAWDQTARIWDLQTGEPRTAELKHQAAVSSVQFSPDGRFVLTGSYKDHSARLWDAAHGQLVRQFPHPDQVTCARFSPDGKRIVTAGYDGIARVWDAFSGDVLTAIARHNAPLWDAEFSPDGEWIATASEDRTARIWNARTGQARTGFIEEKQPVFHVQFSPDGNRILTSGPGAEVRVWDSRSGEAVIEPLQHLGDVTLARFSSDGSLVASASMDQHVRVWNAHQAQLQAEPFPTRCFVEWAELNPDGSLVAAACADGVARVWEVPHASAPAPLWLCTLAEGLAGHRFLGGGGTAPVSAEELSDLRRQLSSQPQTDFYTRWASWFFASPETRPVSPSSTQHLTDYIDLLIRMNTLDGLREAFAMAPENPRVMASLARILAASEDSPRALDEANWLIRRAVNLDPAQTTVLGSIISDRAERRWLQVSRDLSATAGALIQNEWSGNNLPARLPGLVHVFAKLDRSREAAERPRQSPVLILAGHLSERVTVTHKADLNAFPFTVELWFRTENQTFRPVGLVTKYLASSYNGWSIHLTGGNLKAWYFKDPSDYIWDGNEGLDGGPVANGKWHHAALAVDHEGGTIYLDGVAKNHLPWTGTVGPCSTAEDVRMGRMPGLLQSFNGQISDVRIWKTCRTPTQIEADMDHRLKGDEDGLIAYYYLDGTAADQTGGGHDASVKNVRYGVSPKPLTFDATWRIPSQY